MDKSLIDITLQKLIEYNQEDEELLIQKQDQLNRLTDYINSNPTEDDINELKDLKDSLEKEIQALQKDKAIIDNNFSNNDLNKMLDEAKLLISNLYGKQFIEENDTNPSIMFSNINRDKLGYCRTDIRRISGKFLITTEIFISKVLQKFPKEQLMSTVIHEYIHSLRCCLSCNHSGKWKEIADRINSSTEYDINEYADEEQTSSFDNILNNTHKTIYHVVCTNCGAEQNYYTANADIVRHPDHYSHRCSNGEKGSFTVTVEKK